MNDFGASLFQGIIFNDVYSNFLYSNGHYGVTTFIILMTSLTATIIFYYVWNPIYGDWRHWILSLGGGALITSIIVYTLLNNYLARFLVAPQQYPDATTYRWEFTLWTYVLALLFGMAWSFIIKWKSKKNKYQPF